MKLFKQIAVNEEYVYALDGDGYLWRRQTFERQFYQPEWEQIPGPPNDIEQPELATYRGSEPDLKEQS